MPERINDGAINGFQWFSYLMGTWFASLNLTGPQIFGAIVGAVVYVAFSKQLTSKRKAYRFIGSLACGLIGSRMVAHIIVWALPASLNLTIDDVISVAAVLCALVGLIVLGKLLWGAENPEQAAKEIRRIKRAAGTIKEPQDD